MARTAKGKDPQAMALDLMAAKSGMKLLGFLYNDLADNVLDRE